ncbi:segregation/condensation protein A [Ureaplasma sp. ES3154-GEN]|uniref:segregation/condensation protein A n=1 Tax=Ureaplasma sp. ES3154-GEN TaxID=2984844 RepID=UPI0021E843B8|nr:segregation/condensation protein A [Ureaplasma sp. ES3154-GEN]MCV3743310.1 segregation/condensation protein A [Ureaplasma sp. ES3154-GEN]
MDINKNRFDFCLQLNDFDGPLDVLIELIKMGRKNINNLDIVSLTNQYQKYIDEQINTLEDFDLVSDYLYYASHLLRLKVLSLLPNPSLLEQQKLNEDREDLIKRLIEYNNYKKAANYLQECMHWRKKMYDIPQKDYAEFIDEDATFKPLPDKLPITLLKELMDQVILEYELNNSLTKTEFVNPDYNVYDVMWNLITYLQSKPDYTSDLLTYFLDQPSTHKNKRFLVTSLLVILTLIYKEKLKIITNEIDQITITLLELNPNINNLIFDSTTDKTGN